MQRLDRAGRLQPGDYFGASEATIFSKRGSPRGFRRRRGEDFFKARVATKWIPVRVQTQIVVPVISLCSRKLLEEAQCGIALAGMDQKHRHRPCIRLLFRPCRELFPNPLGTVRKFAHSHRAGFPRAESQALWDISEISDIWSCPRRIALASMAIAVATDPASAVTVFPRCVAFSSHG
jgi:hypothetical protein